MKFLTKVTILVSLLAIGLGTTFATTTDELQIIGRRIDSNDYGQWRL